MSNIRGKRRLTVAGIGIACALVASACSSSSEESASADGTTPLKMGFEWTCSGDWSVVYEGLEQGIFKKNGIDLTYDRGQGGSDTVPLVASGEFDLGILSAAPTIIGAGQDMPVTMIGAAATDGPIAILADSSIKTPKDLEGKTLAVQTDQQEGAVWKAFVKATGINGDSINVVPSDDGTQADFLSGKVDAMVVFYPTASVYEFLQQRPDLNVIKMQQYVPMYGHMMVMNDAYLSEHKDVAKGYVTAWAESAKYVIDNWDESYKLLVEKCPEVSPEALEYSMKAYFEGYQSDYAKKNGLGTFSLEGVEETQKVLVDAGLAESRPVSEFATTEYLPNPAIMP